MPVVVVVGLGPAGPGFLTSAAIAALASCPTVLLRTSQHLACEALVADGAVSLDHHYEEARGFDEAYASIVREVVETAHEQGRVAYGVPGSPFVLERTIQLLQQDLTIQLEYVHGLSFLDLAWEALGIDPVDEGVRLIGAEDFAIAASGESGPFLICQCWHAGLLSEVKLALDAPLGARATILHHLGHDEEQLVEVELADLDRSIEPDHLTCVYVPALAAPVGPGLARLDELMRVLRERCPWDAEQTHRSLVRHLLEETYEVIEAIEELDDASADGDVSPANHATHATPANHATHANPANAATHANPANAATHANPANAAQLFPAGSADFAKAAEHLEEELGDLLVQVLFHARLASEEGLFDLADVARTVTEKLVRRHPHVFPSGTMDASGTPGTPGGPGGPGGIPGGPGGARRVEETWEQIKTQEKGRTSVVEGIPASLPALMLASKLERKARSISLGWATTGQDPAAVTALLGQLLDGSVEDAGELMFCLARLVAHLGGDPEELVRRAAGRMREELVAAEASEGSAVPKLT